MHLVEGLGKKKGSHSTASNDTCIQASGACCGYKTTDIFKTTTQLSSPTGFHLLEWLKVKFQLIIFGHFRKQ